MQAKTEKTAPLESDGAFMLGNEQDCYGGCTDDTQAYYGLMDEVGTGSCIHPPNLVVQVKMNMAYLSVTIR